MADTSGVSVKARVMQMKKQESVKPAGESYVKMTRAPPPHHPSTQAVKPPSPATIHRQNPSRQAPPPPHRDPSTTLGGPGTAPISIAVAPSTGRETEQSTMPPLGSSYPERTTPHPLSDTQRPHIVSRTPPTLRRGSAPVAAPPHGSLPPIPKIPGKRAKQDVPPPIPSTPRPHLTHEGPSTTYCSPSMVVPRAAEPDAPPILYPKGVKEKHDAESPPAIPRRPVQLPPPPPGRKTKPPPYKPTSDPIALNDFVSKHKLPQMVRVVAGIYDSLEEKRTMPTDQEFLVYFQKRTKIVRAKPDDHYRVYSIPINSAIKFVPLHKEDAKFTRAAWEGDFDNVADIAKLKVFPLAMRVTRDIVDTDSKPLKQGALLFDIKRKDKGKRKGIKAVDHLGHRHTFYENERVFFSSERDQLQMFVYEFMKFIPFPVKVQAYVPHDFEDTMETPSDSPETMIENFSLFTFEVATEETTLVVNMDVANFNDYKSSVKYIMEVPVDLDIEVECIEFCDAKNNEDMFKCVVYWRETLDRTDGAERKAVNNPYQEHRQKLLQTQVDHSYKDATKYDDIDHVYDYISVREWCQGKIPLSRSKEKSPPASSPSQKMRGVAAAKEAETKKRQSARDLPLPPTPDEQKGMRTRPLPLEPHPPPVKQQMNLTMVPPRSVPPRTLAGEQLATSAPAAPDFFRPLPPRQAAPPAADSDSDGDADEYVETTEFTPPNIVAPVEVPPGGAVDRLHSLKEMSPVAVSPTRPQPVAADLMRYEPMKVGEEAEQDDVEYEVVRGESDLQRRRPEHLSPSPSMNEEDMSKAANRDYLRQLDHVKVLQLLDLMDLSKYRNSFIQEHIDGEVLVDLGEDELKDLGVQSKIHLLRLSKLINGSTPARRYLVEGNPYGSIG